MLDRLLRASSAFLVLSLLFVSITWAQTGRGTITGRIADSQGAVLAGARIDVQPGGASAVSNGQGEFNISDLPAGNYTLTVHYQGFKPFTSDVTVTAGRVSRLESQLEVATKNEEVGCTPNAGMARRKPSTANLPPTTFSKCCQSK